ncbi:LPS-assembly protein LptD [Roseovarius aestuarii]|uniref:LPS-assembly protein LptD n=1 Tax=Roseovarius aestuarii TaxID=475083 RepID=A0A1X7BS38_9RHOB|nr:LPS assembly protein LptD [Roseovarius aestuarii]SMC12384.1 LPS-assembly protein LptD precursor [Roseovarius aestuarii]
MIRRFPRLAAILIALISLPTSGMAQDASALGALLVADEVYITGDDKLVAEGNVEAVYQGQRLKAKSITYDRSTEMLSIEGPMTLNDGQSTLVLADSGELDRNMANGILRGARVVFDDQLQMAAHRMDRVNGRYTQLYKAAVTSCRICNDDHAPLWQIRARRIIHDQHERQIYFHDAQFRVLDVPVFYLPRLRLPDPTLERATGFLIPSLINSSDLGFGVRVPYFIKLGDHRDLTVTPLLATKSTTLALRYRQAFVNGDIEINTAISDDEAGERSTRGYLFAEGKFNLPRDFRLAFDLETVNDDEYLDDYGITAKNRLDSEISVTRARRDEFIRGAVTHFKTLRRRESNATFPTVVGNIEYEKRFFPKRLGGELRLFAEAHSHYRSSDLRFDGPDFDRFADGRDVTRFTSSLDWHRSWILPQGIHTRFQTGVAFDKFLINQAGGTSRSQASEITPSASVVFRMPLIKKTSNNATHIIEPMLQLAWAGGSNPDVPNDESTRVDFDEGNLLSLSRFTAPDRRERGASLAYGINWTRIAPKGWTSTLTFGQVIRNERQLEIDGTTSFTDASGLQGKASDFLLAGQIKLKNGVSFTARSIFEDFSNVTKTEARAGWINGKANIGASYIWLQADPAEERNSDVSEWEFDGSYRISRHWTGSAEWRYDVVADRNVRAGVGVTYTNECVEIELAALRRFRTSTNREATTDISLTVGLRGFSFKTEDKSYVRKCRK